MCSINLLALSHAALPRKVAALLGSRADSHLVWPQPLSATCSKRDTVHATAHGERLCKLFKQATLLVVQAARMLIHRSGYSPHDRQVANQQHAHSAWFA